MEPADLCCSTVKKRQFIAHSEGAGGVRWSMIIRTCGGTVVIQSKDYLIRPSITQLRTHITAYRAWRLNTGLLTETWRFQRREACTDLRQLSWRLYLWSPCTTSAAHTATTICMLTHSTAQMRIDCGGKGLNWAISWFVVWTIWQKNSNRFHSHATDSRSLCTEAEIDSCANQETESYHSKEAKITTYLASGSGIKKSIDLWLGLCVQEWVMTCPSERLSSKKKKKRCGKNDLHVGRGVWVKTWGRNQTEPSKL